MLIILTVLIKKISIIDGKEDTTCNGCEIPKKNNESSQPIQSKTKSLKLHNVHYLSINDVQIIQPEVEKYFYVDEISIIDR